METRFNFQERDRVRSREWNDRQREIDPGFRGMQPNLGEILADEIIEQNVRAALALSGLEILESKVQVIHGTAVIWGRTRTSGDRDRAIDVTWHASGVIDVIEELEQIEDALL